MEERINDRDWLEAEVARLPVRHIAKKLGLPYSRVYARVKSFGIPIPKRNGYIFTEETRLAKSQASKAAYHRKYPHGRFGQQASNWRGGRRAVNGYIALYMPGHPRATTSNRVFEHIVVAEEKIGRVLEPDEVVHHINGDKQDNRPENLEVCKRSEHVHHHLTSGKGIQTLRQRIAYLEQLLIDNGIKFD